MKILHVTRMDGKGTRYGIQTSLETLIRGLKDSGHEVELITQGALESVPLSRFEKWIISKYLHRMENRFGSGAADAMAVLRERVEIGIRAAKVAKRLKINYVHCHDPLLGHMYGFFRKIYGATPRWGFTVHTFGRFAKLHPGVNTNEVSLQYLQKQESKAFKQARWIHFPTEAGMTQCIADMGNVKLTKRWSVIPHAVELALLSREEARKRLGIGEHERVLVAIGVLFALKRFDLLLDAIAKLPANLIDRIIILGDGPEREHLLNLAGQLNLIHLLEITTTEEVGLYLSSADIYVSTSQTESFGMANCEAMLAGVPCVCTAVDAVPEILQDGAILTSDQPDEIAGAIQSILSSPVIRETLLFNAKQVTASWKTPEEIACMFEEVLLQPTKSKT